MGFLDLGYWIPRSLDLGYWILRSWILAYWIWDNGILELDSGTLDLRCGTLDLIWNLGSGILDLRSRIRTHQDSQLESYGFLLGSNGQEHWFRAGISSGGALRHLHRAVQDCSRISIGWRRIRKNNQEYSMTLLIILISSAGTERETCRFLDRQFQWHSCATSTASPHSIEESKPLPLRITGIPQGIPVIPDYSTRISKWNQGVTLRTYIPDGIYEYSLRDCRSEQGELE